MTEHNDQTATLPPEGPPAPPAAPAATEPAAPRVRRTLGLPVVAAIAGATLLIGGLAGGIIGYAVHSDSPDFSNRQGFPGQGFQQGQQGGPGSGSGSGNGMPQPPTDQQDDGGSDS